MILSVVIVSYNTKELLSKCLQSLDASLKSAGLLSKSEIIVVDNASTDGSVEMIQKKFPKVVLIKNSANLGFGGANNQGIRQTKGDFVLLLNSDTVLYPTTIKSSLDEIAKTKADILGPALLNPDESVQQSVGYFPNLVRVFLWMLFLDNIPLVYNLIKPYHVKVSSFYKSDHWVDWVTAAYFLARSKVFAKNLFDPKVFMYAEEVELCYRIKKQGFKILYSPVSTLLHLKGGSGSGQTAGIKEELYGIEYIYRKHSNILAFLVVKLLLTLGALLRIFIFGIMLKSEKRKKSYLEYLKLVG
ncbi:glycosyltransferase family 2 protein [Candidatus Gottesmanbacteria bacterium]|nr:glycosyltransferase family 2 protein [Candidatus Gottesmanbacteria bacterium]